MPSDLLQTKLHPPRLRRPTVPRPRLSARLSRSWECTLALVSAPAGFGKTTLLSEWSSSGSSEGRATAWLSLDQRDNDPGSFWCYVVAALQAASPGLGAAALELLPSSVRAGLERLLNDLGDLNNELVLILDDYHVIESLDVHEQMSFFLDHLPGNFHLVLATRVDPALPLARLRARGELVEVRVADLRFTPGEATAYLRDSMRLNLTDGDVEALEGRTEGWIAALQMAALSIQGRVDATEFIAGFAGDDRYIVDYLAQEVLHRQPARLRSFLLETSVLGRMSGPLCDAVTGHDGGKATLEELDRGNLFVVALDDRRCWYRYHHLFADVLRAFLLDERPDRVTELHLRASEWYERQGDLAEAVDHATAGGHFPRAAALVERALPAVRRDRQEVTLRRWLDALPDELVRASPVLSLGYAGALMAHAEVEGVEEHLQHVEKWLTARAGASATTTAPQDQQLRTLPGAVAMYRAGLARIRGDVAGTMRYARRALDLVGEDDDLERGGAAALLGLAHWEIGELAPARELYAQALASLDRAGHLPDVLGCTIALADLETAGGRLGQAGRAYERALHAADEAPRVPRGTADMHVGIASLFVERNQMAAAVEHLRASEALGADAALPQNRYRWRVVMSFVREAEGDAVGALQLLADAERLYDTDYSPDVRPVAALTARVWIRQGRTREALAWARTRELSVDDELSYLREFEHLTLARLLLARLRSGTTHPVRELDPFLERLLRAAEDGSRSGSVLEILVLLALTAQARGDLTRTAASLQRAVALAEPEGYVRVFAEHGAPMAALLRSLVSPGTADDYASQLLAAVSDGHSSAPARTGLVESLSDREVDVMRLLGSDLDGPDIARQLVVSVNTVRTHTRNIYAKLGVNSRRAAVRRAHELELLSTRR